MSARGRLGAALLGATLALAPASAPEPVIASVEGTAPLGEGGQAAARQQALGAALLEAVVAAARPLVAPEKAPGEEPLREALRPLAASAIVTYRIDGDPTERASAIDPGTRELVLRVTATVDGRAVRERLRAQGWLASGTKRASALVLARPLDAAAVPAPALAELEDFVKGRLSGAGFAVVEPSVREPAGEGSALARARALGADVAIELIAAWDERREAGRPPGGVAEVHARALRTSDGSELSVTRFEAPAYDPDPRRARAMALEALRGQVADNLLLQLGRNWQTLEAGERELVVTLSNVGSLAQVERVEAVLRSALGADEVGLGALGPRSAELIVRAAVSPGGVQERLLAAPFEGFRLEPVELTGGRVALRVVEAQGEPPGAGPAGGQAPGEAREN